MKETDNVEQDMAVADTWQLQRIADAMEEILRLVKEDQAQYKKEPEQSWPTGLGKKENAKEKN